MEQSDNDIFSSDKGGIITARGTGEGLVIRLDGRVERDSLKEALVDFLSSRREFLTGNDVAFEWVGARPEDELVEELSQTLQKEFSIDVRASRMREVPKPIDSVGLAAKAAAKVLPGPSAAVAKSLSTTTGRSVSLFDGIEALGGTERRPAPSLTEPIEEERKPNAVHDAALWDDPDARIVCATLRSGQKIETEHSLVVFGDVNSGAELIAGGDIVVLGTLRGVAHAGAYDETGGGRVIFALDLQPTQLRIGMVISRGGGSDKKSSAPEVARVESNLIVVEPYQARLVANRRRV
jgi:septum site-determining protein MinC